MMLTRGRVACPSIRCCTRNPMMGNAWANADRTQARVSARIGDHDTGPVDGCCPCVSAVCSRKGLAAECPTSDPKRTNEGRNGRVLKLGERCGVDVCHRAPAASHSASAPSGGSLGHLLQLPPPHGAGARRVGACGAERRAWPDWCLSCGGETVRGPASGCNGVAYR